jgi:hypothetical protein
MKIKILMSALATAFTVSVAEAAETSDVQSQLDQLKSQISVLEAKVKTQNATIQSEQGKSRSEEAHLAEEEKEFDDLDDRVMGIRQERGYSIPGFGTARNYGLDMAEDGSETLITAPQLNKDYSLLLQNQFVNDEVGEVSDTGARVQFSGTVQASFEADSNPFGQVVDDTGNYETEEKSDLLGQAEFDLSAQINDWVTGYIHYFSSTEPGVNVEMEQAFIVFGNLDRSPTYASVGKEFVSSGGYSTNMVSRPLTREVGRFRANEATVGTFWDGFRGNIFGYDNERELEGDTFKSLGQWGAQIEYFSQMSDSFEDTFGDDWSFKAGVAYVNDISTAESYDSSNVLSSDEEINEYIPSGNVYARVGYQEWSLLGEYQHNFEAFEADELSMNSDGAKIAATNVELTYRFDVGRPSWITANYGQSSQALALQLPQRVYGVTYGINILKNTVLSFEYLLQQDYSEDDFAFAPGNLSTDNLQLGTGENNNQFTAQVDVFF